MAPAVRGLPLLPSQEAGATGSGATIEMTFFIALTVLLTAASAFLLHQFRTRAFAGDDAAPADDRDADAQELRAA